jgi:hypothetical protein
MLQAGGMRELLVAAAWSRECSADLSNLLLSTWLELTPLEAREQALTENGQLIRNVLPHSAASDESHLVFHWSQNCLMTNVTMHDNSSRFSYALFCALSGCVVLHVCLIMV